MLPVDEVELNESVGVRGTWDGLCEQNQCRERGFSQWLGILFGEVRGGEVPGACFSLEGWCRVWRWGVSHPGPPSQAAEAFLSQNLMILVELGPSSPPPVGSAQATVPTSPDTCTTWAERSLRGRWSPATQHQPAGPLWAAASPLGFRAAKTMGGPTHPGKHPLLSLSSGVGLPDPV